MGTGDNLQGFLFPHLKASPPAAMKGFWSAEEENRIYICFKVGGNWLERRMIGGECVHGVSERVGPAW